jgi:hypothetical protein
MSFLGLILHCDDCTDKNSKEELEELEELRHPHLILYPTQLITVLPYCSHGYLSGPSSMPHPENARSHFKTRPITIASPDVSGVRFFKEHHHSERSSYWTLPDITL